MPIYEYQCQKCKKVHEIWQKITEDPATKCPDCKGKLERLISQSGFALKGSGWYKTDYQSSGSSSKKADSGGEKKSESKAETKSESKSESKSDSGSADKKTHKSNSPVRKD